MPPTEILKDLGEFTIHVRWAKGEHTLQNVVGTGAVDGIEFARLSRRSERPDNDASGVRPEVQRLAIQECGMGQGSRSFLG